jgi:hypothetical protein
MRLSRLPGGFLEYAAQHPDGLVAEQQKAVRKAALNSHRKLIYGRSWIVHAAKTTAHSDGIAVSQQHMAVA